MDENSLSEDYLNPKLLNLPFIALVMDILLEKPLPPLHRAVTLAENQNLRIDKPPEHVRIWIASNESLELQRHEHTQKKQSIIDQINKG